MKATLEERVALILKRYHRPAISPQTILRQLQTEGIVPACLPQIELEEEVRWTVINRIESSNNDVPGWRFNPLAADTEGFFE